MAGKQTFQRAINAPAALSGGETIDADTVDVAPPAQRAIDGPENLALSTALVRSAVTPEANISATWDVLIGAAVDQFIVQISTDSAFPDNNTRTLFTPGDQDSITIAALKTGTTYYVRVALLMQAAQSAWSATVSQATGNDTTPPGPVTGAAADFTGRDCVLTWANPTSDNFRHVRVDIYASNGGTHLRTAYTAAPHYTYTGDQNLVDTSAVGDPTLYVILTPVSWFGVDSASPVNLSPTNAAPSAPSVSAVVGFTQIIATVTSAPPLDLDVYEFVWKDGGGATVRTAYTQGATDIYQATTTDTYSVVVRVRDIFGQYSSGTTTGSLVVDALTITDLRADSTYSDSIGTSFASAPNKTVLKDDTTGAGISYAASASAWRWTKIAYPLTDRFRRISLSLGSGSANFYVGLSSDDVTYTWYSGALTGIVLALVASEAAAQAAAPLFSALPGGYAELPATIEARYIKIGHRNTTTGYRLDEAYGQRLVIADVIKVGQLSAITADMGSITAGTITGALIRTAASGARLQLTSSAFEGYTASAQFLALNPTDGISITLDTAAANLRAYTFTGSTGVGTAGLYAFEDGSSLNVELLGGAVTGKSTGVTLNATGDSVATIVLGATASGGDAFITLSTNGATQRIDLLDAPVYVDLGLNIGSATGAGANEIRAAKLNTDGLALLLGGAGAITGTPRLAVQGADSSVSTGPDTRFFTATDAYPLLDLMPFGHDAVYINFDSYYDGTNWKSGDAGSNFQIAKVADTFGINYKAGVAQGSTVAWSPGITLNSSGGVNIGSATGAAAGDLRASGVLQAGAASMAIDMKDITALANNGVAQLANVAAEFGFAFVVANTGGLAIYALRGGGHTTAEIADPSGVYSITAGTAGTNIYWSAANTRYEIENKTGGTVTYHVTIIRN